MCDEPFQRGLDSSRYYCTGYRKKEDLDNQANISGRLHVLAASEPVQPPIKAFEETRGCPKDRDTVALDAIHPLNRLQEHPKMECYLNPMAELDGKQTRFD